MVTTETITLFQSIGQVGNIIGLQVSIINAQTDGSPGGYRKAIVSIIYPDKTQSEITLDTINPTVIVGLYEFKATFQDPYISIEVTQHDPPKKDYTGILISVAIALGLLSLIKKK